MCGIIGTTRGDETAVRVGLDALAHRGPDDRGIFSDGGVVLGQARLAIIDLSPMGHQPMVEGDLAAITFNGEIYNYRELKEDLVRKGCRFKGGSDTEVILQGYCREGASFLGKMRGMWALAMYDKKKGEVLLSRDFFGIKPLYYTTVGGVLRFSSEIRALKKISPSFKPDAANYYQYYNLGYFIGASTCYEEVKKVLPGEVITWNLAAGSSKSRILPLPAGKKNPSLDFDGAVSLMEKSIIDSLDKHYIADVEVGLLLSGGADSSLLAALSKRIGRNPVCYHLTIPGSIDAEYARKIARHLGFTLIETELTDASLQEAYRGMHRWLDLPTSDVSIIPTSLVYGSIGAQSKVVLSGEGGDELFGGYVRHERLAQLDGMQPEPSRSSALLSKLYPASSFASGHIHPLVRRIDAKLAASGNDLIDTYLHLTKTAGFPILPDRMHRDLYALYSAHPYKSLTGPSLFFDRSMYLADSLMYKNDIASMASSIEARVPLVDREVAVTASEVPDEFSLAPEYRRKQLLKAILARHLPQELVDRPKKGFGFSFGDFDARFFVDDFEKAVRFHLEHASELGVPDDMRRMLTALKPELLCMKFPRFAFSLITNHLIIGSS